MGFFHRVLILVVVSLPIWSFSGGKPESNKTKAEAQLLDEKMTQLGKVLSRYRVTLAVRAEVKKVVRQALLDKTINSSGELFVASGRMRLEVKKPESSLLVYNGKEVWFEVRLDEQTVQVTKFKARDLRKSSALIAVLFDEKDLRKKFKLLKWSAKPEGLVYELEPLNKDSTEAQLVTVVLDTKSHIVREISYRDDLGNEVKFALSNTQFGYEAPAKTFTYQPPEGAEVTEYK